MYDSDFLEKEAENRIASELARYEIIIAKPMVDKLGADLLAMLRVDDGARFVRVQSKGRSIVNSKSCHIEIPKDYVTKSFVCFLYLRLPSESGVMLSVFFSEDILSWTLNPKDKFTYSVSEGSYLDKLKNHEFDDNKAKKLIRVIQDADVREQFNIFTDLQNPVIIHGNRESDYKVSFERIGGISVPVVKNTITGSEHYGSDCPGNPDDFDYDPTMDIWISKEY